MASKSAPKSNLIKLIILGDGIVGKSSILKRFVSDVFEPISTPYTMGIDFQVKTIDINGKQIKLQVWDTAGQEIFHSISANFCRGAMAMIYVYDVTRKNTFNNIESWIEFSKKNSLILDVPRILVANKVDLMDNDCVTLEKGQTLAKKHEMGYLETSALTGKNIEELFITMAKMVMDKQKIDYSGTNTSIDNDGEKLSNYVIVDVDEKKDGCCH